MRLSKEEVFELVDSAKVLSTRYRLSKDLDVPIETLDSIMLEHDYVSCVICDQYNPIENSSLVTFGVYECNSCLNDSKEEE